MHGVIMLGMPCSGKSSIGRMYAEMFGHSHISSGDIARELAEHDEDIRDDLTAGRLAPEVLIRSGIKSRISMARLNGKDFVLDGFPRFGDQTKWLMETFPDVQLVRVHIYVTEAEALYRAMKRGRDDDTAIVERIRYYQDVTYPSVVSGMSDITVCNCGARNDGDVVNKVHEGVMKIVDRSQIRPIRPR